ncbi:MAG: thiamine-phosphate pyrophosphorylase [Motiliproteus sp.]|jgi:thiamine-phosphate pyrophosphorylase
MLRGLYAITDATLTPEPELLIKVSAALRGGARIIQYRDKSRDAPTRLRQARALTALCHRFQRPLIINDDPELALACDAAGVHLGQGDTDLTRARALLGKNALIGITCHDSLELALQAQQQGADYVAFGAFFPSTSKPGARAAPLALLQQARQRLHVPIVAIGGIRVDNAPQIITQGAAMVAVIQDLFAATDVEERARQLTGLFDI